MTTGVTQAAALVRERMPGKSAKSRRAGLVAMAPFVVFMLVFGVYPLVEVARMSLAESDIEDGRFVSTFVGLSNYLDVLGDATAWKSIWITSAFVAITVAGTMLIGTGLALLVERAVVLKAFAQNVLVWPAVVTPVVVSVVWLLILSPTVGGLNKILTTLGVSGQAWLNSDFGAFALINVVDIWHWTPIVFLFAYTALIGLDKSILEASRIDGASEKQMIRYVVLPLLKPALGAALLVRMIQSIKAFDEIYLLTKGGPRDATLLLNLHIRRAFFDRLEYGYATALGIVVVVATLATIAIFFYLQKRTTK